MQSHASPKESFKAKAYLKADCPYSFRFLLFMSEARLLEQIEVIRCDPKDAGYEQVKAKLQSATGGTAEFPTVEIEPGVYKSDSGKLIDHYAKKNNVSVKSLPVLSFYEAGIFPQLRELHE
jgi:hypothetical protein